VVLLAFPIVSADGQSPAALREALQNRYDLLSRSLVAGAPGLARQVIAEAYAEVGDTAIRGRDAKVSALLSVVRRYPDVGPIHTTIESVHREPGGTVLALTRITTHARTEDRASVLREEVRRDQWTQRAGRWQLTRSELRTATDGELIPGPGAPTSERLVTLLADIGSGHRHALEEFWAEVADRGPLVEAIRGDSTHSLVTFLFRHSAQTIDVGLFGELPYPVGGGRSLIRLPGTDVWYRSLRTPNDTRTTYGFDIYRDVPGAVGARNRFIVSVMDPRNPMQFNEASVLELAGASPQPYLAARPGVPRGRLVRDSLTSAVLGEKRLLTIYLPPGWDSVPGTFSVAVLFDGGAYGGSRTALVPTPTILDNLLADRRIPPTIAVLVHQRRREAELNGSTLFTRFMADEVMPHVRATYRGSESASRVIIGGSSLGGAAAAFAALARPDVFGGVLSQSGAFWLPQAPNDVARQALIPPVTWIVDEFVRRPAVPLRVWMEVSIFESTGKMLAPNRQLRDVLRAKGYDVTYREVHGGHDYLHWRASLADGLVALLAPR